MEFAEYGAAYGVVGGADALDPDFLTSIVHWDTFAASLPGPSLPPDGPPPPTTHADADTPGAEASAHPLCVSTAFNADRNPSAAAHAPDLQLVCPDGVHFLVDSARLRSASSNAFAGTLAHAARGVSGAPPRVHVPDSADVLNVLLHIAYGASPEVYKPVLGTLIGAVRRLAAYGLDPQAHVVPGSALFEFLRRQVALAPMSVYCLAGAHDLRALAQVASAHLLSYPLHRLSDEEAREMGPLYLKRLFLLHQKRICKLKELLDRPPEFHAATSECSFAAQKGVARGWSRAIRHVTLDAGPDIVGSTLQHKLSKFKDAIPCQNCKAAIDARIWQVLVGWTMTPATID